MKVLSLNQVSQLTGRGRSTLYQMITTGTLPAKKLGGSTVILERDLNTFLEALPDAREGGAIRSKRTA